MPRLWSCSTRELLQHWTKSSIIPSFKEKGQSGGTGKAQKAGPFPSWKTDRLLDLRVTSGSLGANYSVENYADLFTICSSKWWYAGIRFEMRRKSIVPMTKIPPDDILEGFVQIKKTRDRETQDRIGIVQNEDSSEEVRTWLSQIENNGEKKYRARNSK